MTLSVEELHERLSKGEKIKLLDVREEEEWNLCHLPHAILVPLSEFRDHIFDVLRSEELAVIYCHHGIRSAQAQNFLRAQGFNHVYNLAGGIEEWAKIIDPSMARY